MLSFKSFRENSKKVDEAESFLDQPSSEAEQTNASPDQAPQQTQTQQQSEAPQQAQESPQQEQTSPRASLAEKIKPQYESAKAIIESIHEAFKDDCGKTTKYDNMGSQIKNFEKQIRGACQQLISVVEQEKFNWHDYNICSPKSFKCVTLYDSRDLDVLKLCAGIIIFYNSLIGEN